MNLLIATLALLVLLEILGRFLYPLSREARANREAGRDHRQGLSYLGGEAGTQTVLRDMYLMKKRYLPFVGWLGAPNTRLNTIETDALGFRGKAIEARAECEYRILITGGSLAWGLGASSDSMTIAGQLEALLNRRAPGTRYRVMNGAFMNWSSRHEYAAVTEFIDHFDPDLVVSLSGYNDLVALSKGIENSQLPESRLLERAVMEYQQPLGTLRALRKFAGTLGIWRIIVLLREMRASRAPSHQLYGYDPQNGPRRAEKTVQRYISIADYLARNGRDYLIALEPEIYTSKKPLTVEEFDLKSYFMEIDSNLMPTLTRYRREVSSRLMELAGDRFQFIDLVDAFDEEARPVFIDYNHVCDLGNLLLARTLAKAIPENPFVS